MAAALRVLLRKHAAAPPSPMLRSLFPAPYSKAAAASLPAARGAPLPPPRLREVTPRKAPPTPKDEPRYCRTVPSTMTDSTKPLLDKLKDLKASNESLQDMEKNIEEHKEMIRKSLHDVKVANVLFTKRIDDRQKLIAELRSMLDDFVKTLNMQDEYGQIRNLQDAYGKIHNMLDGCAKIEKMQDDYDKDWAIQEDKVCLTEEQVERLSKDNEDYLNALRRYHELKRSTMKHVEKVAEVGAAVGLVGGLLLYWQRSDPRSL